MSKPEKWEFCPSVILEDWLWSLVLDYDPYESSKAQAIYDILCSNESGRNTLILKAAWDAMTEEQWQEMLSRKIAEVEFTLKRLKERNGLTQNNFLI